jgi:chemotaxis protein CheX
MTLPEHHVRTVVRTIWSTQLGLEVQDCPEVETETDDAVSPTMTASIQISGDSHGDVRLRCSRELVRKAAGIMFELPEDRLSIADERDVIGELTNVIAGNIKALIPGSNSISLPTIVEGSDYTVSSVDVASIEEHAFSHEGEVFVVTIVDHGG